MTIGIICAAMLLGFAIDLPIFVAVIGAVFLYFLTNNGAPPTIAVQRLVGSSQNLSLLAVPFFIMLGTVMNHTGITRRLLGLAEMLVGRYRGGLAQANILLSTMMGGLSASNLADCAMLTKMLLPEMERCGYSRSFAAAVTASGSLITPIIPPGIALIIYGFLADVSIGKMFMAGILPGLLCAIALMFTAYLVSVKKGYAPSRCERVTSQEFFTTLKNAVPALTLVVVIIGGIRFGVFTPTEAGAVAVAYVIGIGLFVYKEMRPRHILEALMETTRSTASVMIIIMACSALAWIFSWEQVAQNMATAITHVTTSPVLFLLMINAIFLVMGMFLEGNAILIVLVPLLKPTVEALGIDLIHFGLVIILNLSIGTLTPPVGTVMLLVTGLSGTSVLEFFKTALPFYIALIVCLLLLSFFPQITLLLPNMMN
ncbi:TRAP transporter large permease [Oceanidesulfovibrio marinus]|uniref:C4-dicarboxylate ABC transporter n=1 Tax=Oceanidesulfovibrio marinus TaxID=370038 RepID=A0A6P1ZIB5_9BACT|nr:TRAP transporter large permease [Oceanidesulfovibrio marinus]QJT07567.1 TRAP transporter large permease [Oceanidesulfovibrio marinus]TVM34518.1 C4-dicarboxylate ABC transporter [Oceanidesulfovibrio marinus]